MYIRWVLRAKTWNVSFGAPCAIWQIGVSLYFLPKTEVWCGFTFFRCLNLDFRCPTRVRIPMPIAHSNAYFCLPSKTIFAKWWPRACHTNNFSNVFWTFFEVQICFAFCTGHTFAMILEVPEPMFYISQGFFYKKIEGHGSHFVEVLHCARVWVCLDALAGLGVLGRWFSFWGRLCILQALGPDSVERPWFRKPF